MKDVGFTLKNEKNKRAVILYHGMTGSPFELVFYGKALHKAGYDVYCPVLPGHCDGVDAVKFARWQDWHDFALRKFDEISPNYEETYVSGLCLGAILSLNVAQERQNVAGVSALSTTLFLDGWKMPWFKFLFPIGLHTILKFFYVFPEEEPYGVKNERMRKKIEKSMEANLETLDCIPMMCVLELLRCSKYSRKNMKKLTAPIILFHSEEDDLTSIKSAYFVHNNVSSERKELIKLNDCYHNITLDNEKDFIIQKTLEFFGSISKVSSKEEDTVEEAQV